MNIGIVGKIKDGTQSNSFGISSAYYDFFSQFGNVFVIPPLLSTETERYIKFTDLLVLPGGADISFNRYLNNTRLHSKLGNADPFLEFFDQNVLEYYINACKPIVGICRGIQTLNVHFGGTLHQDIFHYYSQLADEQGHTVKDSSNKGLFKVNSLHHQAIKDLGDKFHVLLTSSDGFIEAIKHNSLPIFAVQFHPELLNELEKCVIWTVEQIEGLFK